MLENLIKETKAMIAKFIDYDCVEVKVVGKTLEVSSGFITVFHYNFQECRTISGQTHKVGLTPARLIDLSAKLRTLAA